MRQFSFRGVRRELHKQKNFVTFLLILVIQCAFILPNSVTIALKTGLSILLLLICLKGTKGKIVHVKYVYWMACLFIGVTISFIFVKDWNGAIDYSLKFFFSYFVVFSLLQAIRNIDDVQFCFDAFMVCGVIYLALVVILQGPANLLINGIDRQFTNGTMMNLTYISIPTSILIGWSLIERRIKLKVGIPLWIFVYIMNVLSERRKATLIPLIAILVLYLIKNKKRLDMKKIVGLVAIGSIIAFFLRYSTVNPYLYEHFGYRIYNLYTTLLSESGEVVYADKSLGARANAIQIGFAYFLEHPITPLGIGNFGRIYILSHAHNNYIEMISTLGIWTACIYYFMYFFVLKVGKKFTKNDLGLLVFSIIIINLITDYATSTYWESTYASYLMLCYMAVKMTDKNIT